MGGMETGRGEMLMYVGEEERERKRERERDGFVSVTIATCTDAHARSCATRLDTAVAFSCEHL